MDRGCIDTAIQLQKPLHRSERKEYQFTNRKVCYRIPIPALGTRKNCESLQGEKLDFDMGLYIFLLLLFILLNINNLLILDDGERMLRVLFVGKSERM